MAIIVMIITLTGGFGHTSGAPVIQGFRNIDACKRAIPMVRKSYAGEVSSIKCVEIPSQ